MRVFAVSLTWEVSRLGGSGCAIMGLASIGGHCPLCDLMQLREGVLILGPSLLLLQHAKPSQGACVADFVMANTCTGAHPTAVL